MNMRKIFSIAALIAVIGLMPLEGDAGQNLGVYALNAGGTQNFTNTTAAAIIKAAPGALRTLSVVAPGTTSGAWTFYDVNNTPAAYSGSTQYAACNGVTSGGNTYQALSTPPVGTATSNTTFWVQVGAILNIPFGATNNYAGSVIQVNIVTKCGISLTAVPGAGSPILAGSFD